MEHFSDRLRYARKKRKLSQTELARASGLSQGAISSYETGARRSTTELIQLAQALKVSPEWLITGTGSMEKGTSPAVTDNSRAKLQEAQPQPISVAWPFSTIKPNEYWALPETQRRVVEQTIAALISAMRQEENKN